MKKLLHLSFHRGARAEIRWVGRQLGIEVEDFDFNDGSGNERYNLTPERSEVLWDQVRSRINDFDYVLTSDTASLARPFLIHRKDFRGRLIVWVNNRFDYWHGRKPDTLFYEHFRAAEAMPETVLVPYTEFEIVYAAERGVSLRREVIRPIGLGLGRARVAKMDRYFIPPYHNDVLFFPSMPKVLSTEFMEHRRYEGVADIARFRGIIHIPYSWSNYALFEHWAQGIPYYVPSLGFFRKLYSQGGLFFPDANYSRYWHLSEWWRKENRGRFIYFNSWAELKHRLFWTRKLKLSVEKDLGKKIIRSHAVQTERTLQQWRDVLDKPIAAAPKKKFLFFPRKQPLPRKRVAVLVTATNRYLECFPAFYDRARVNFLPGVEKHFFVMTDRVSDPILADKPDVTPVSVEHKPWPFPTLLRFRYIERISEKLKSFTHLVAIDVDTAVIVPVDEKELLGHKKALFAVRHPGFVGKKGTFETDPRSLAAVSKKESRSIYRAGGMWGGRAPEALALARELARRIDEDLSREIIAVWHDESHLNKYLIENQKDLHTLDPGYMYPESADLPYRKRILALNKNHAMIRAEASAIPKVSVVLPVFNAAGHLAEAIDSILKQTLREYELIIVDDGSVDASPQILRRYADADSRIRVITQPNRGIVEALNRGCREARGKYIARMDADDISLPSRFEKQYEFLENSPEVGVVGTWYSLIHQGGGEGQPPTLDGAIRWTMTFHNCICHPSVMMRRELLEALGGYQPVQHCEDYDLWMRAAKTASLRNLPEVMFRYRISERGVSKRFSEIQNENHLKLMRQWTEDVLGREVSEEDVLVLRQADAFPEIRNPQHIESASKLLDELHEAFLKKEFPVEDRVWITGDYHRRKYILASKAAQRQRSFSLRAKKVFYFLKYFHYSEIRPKLALGGAMWRVRDLARKADRKLFRGAVYGRIFRPLKFFVKDVMKGAFFDSLVRVNISGDKLLVITHAYNRPDFIEMQHKSFKKFLKESYRFIVFNDASERSVRKEIRKVCRRLGLTCIGIRPSLHLKPYLERLPGETLDDTAVRCADAVQYSLNTLGFRYKGKVMIIDSDMFLVRDFSARTYLDGYDMAGLPQSRSNVDYLWNGLVMFDMMTLPDKGSINFNCGRVNGIAVDVGGHLYHYFKKNPQVRVRAIDHATFDRNELPLYDRKTLEAMGFDGLTVSFLLKGPAPVEFLADRTFLHYRGGTDWDRQGRDYHCAKTALFQEYLDEAIGQNGSGTPLLKYRALLEAGTFEGWPAEMARPQSRYDTFRKAFSLFEQNRGRTIVELGTTRSFCGGAYEGCNRDEASYWEPDAPEKWDWGAGSFTRVAAETFSGRGSVLHTVDAASSHIARCRVVTKPFKEMIRYHVGLSEDFLRSFKGKIDLLYLDTGDMTPIEPTAELHLREAKIIVERKLVRDGGLILIDDVGNLTPKRFGETSELGKGKYSIPYFLENGFELLETGYQYLLRKKTAQ